MIENLNDNAFKMGESLNTLSTYYKDGTEKE